MANKPHLKIIAGRPVTVHEDSPQLAEARRRFGRPFAHEPGSNWIAYPERVLTRWGRKADWRNVKRGGA